MSVAPEILRWLSDLVRERLSAALTLRFADAAGWELAAPGASGRLEIAADASAYRKLAVALPPCAAHWDPRPEGWTAPLGLDLLAPGLAELPRPLVVPQRDGLRLSFDCLWLALWALSRGEEAALPERDVHGRFPASASHAMRLGYLDRPLVDEWFGLLRQLAQRTWPGLPLRPPGFRVAVSHDVDEPRFIGGFSFRTMLRRAGGDLFHRGRYRRGGEAPFRWLLCRAGMRAADPYDTFHWIMRAEERRSLRSTFHFLCGNTDARFDRGYHLSEPYLRARLTAIHSRGHVVGLHPSYGSYCDESAIHREVTELRRHCADLRIPLPAIAGRMHFLRWATPETPRALASAGVSSDCTLAYAEQVGFRCGTCVEYAAFDPVGLRPIDLRISPLIAMDGSVLPGRPYMNLPWPAAESVLVKLKNRCRSVGGCFTLCWHNSELDTAAKRRLFLTVLDA